MLDQVRVDLIDGEYALSSVTLQAFNAFSCSVFNALLVGIRAVRGPAPQTQRRRVLYETLNFRANCLRLGLCRQWKASKALKIRISVSGEVLGKMVVVKNALRLKLRYAWETQHPHNGGTWD